MKRPARCSPASHCFILSNVDSAAYTNGPKLYAGNPDSPIWRILRDGKYPLVRDEHLCTNLIGPNTVGCNAGHLWDVDGTDPVSVSGAMMAGRKIAAEIRNAVAEYCGEAFADAMVASTSCWKNQWP